MATTTQTTPTVTTKVVPAPAPTPPAPQPPVVVQPTILISAQSTVKKPVSASAADVIYSTLGSTVKLTH
jgi:hypothetical protein